MKVIVRLFFLSLMASSTLVFTGCPNTRTPPDPSITAVAGGGGSAGEASNVDPFWIDAAALNRAGSEGLQPRRFRPSTGGGMDGILEDMLPSVFFDFNRASIRPEDQPSVEQAAEFLLANPNARLLVEGHCDWRGTPEYNLALGDRRAASVREFLLQLGVAPDRVETVSKGDLEAVTDGSDRQMSQDRRADLLIVQ